ncbi:MAG: small, acid-soluble spore protein alpha/beta type [Clostridia bacterium]|nr:small, acid-soluble spore protein alpha/beta type [Clostridia bacterium]
MKSKVEKTKKKKELKPEDIMKYEIANELGLGEKLSHVGWGGLTAEETGRIGGIITRRKKAIIDQINNIRLEKKA